MRLNEKLRAELHQLKVVARPEVIAAIADASGALSGRTCDEDFEFAFALDLLLEAFDRLHRAGWSSA